MDGDELADLVPLSDLDRGRLARVLKVLWCEADLCEGKDVCVFAYFCIAVDDDV